MTRLTLFALAFAFLLSGAARAEDAPPGTPAVPPAAAPSDATPEERRARLLEIVVEEGQVPERVQAVSDLAAVDQPMASKALLDALDKLAARTSQAEVRAAKTRQDYERYKGGAQANEKDWAIKQRLLKQMDRDDAILRGDSAVEEAFVAAFAKLKDKESIGFLDRAAAKNELVRARGVLYAGLLRNPATNSVEIGTRAIADQDASVRLAALVAFGERANIGLAELAVKSLSDPNWVFRQAAARALGSIADVKTIGALVIAMSAEEGQLLEDYADALAKLTGERLGPNPDAWRRWVDDHKAELSAKGAKPLPPKRGANPLLPPLDYYGIQTRSLRLLFLIDCSGSMNEVIGQAGVTTGEQFKGPKIEIAKRMLKAAVAQLHPSTMFNVITFSTDARQFNEGLIQATPENKHLTHAKVDELAGSGGTWTYGGLKLAFGLADANVTPSKPPIDTIFLLSDGAPTEANFENAVESSAMDPQKILDSVRQWNPFRAVRVYTIAIDARIGSKTVGTKFVRFMKALAEENGGTYTAIGGE